MKPASLNNRLLSLLSGGALLACALFPVPAAAQTSSAPARPGMAVPNASANVAGRWLCLHPDWTDMVTFKPDGSFARSSNGDAGKWHVTLENGRRTLHLDWDSYGSEVFTMVNADVFRETMGENAAQLSRLTGEAATFDPHAPAKASPSPAR